MSKILSFHFIFICLQPTDRRISVDDANPRPTKVAAHQQKLKHMDMLKAPDFPLRPASVDVCHPRLISSPSTSRRAQPMPLPLPPQSSSKTINRRPVLGREGVMPSNLLNELNSVLTKTKAKSDGWQEVKSGKREANRKRLQDTQNEFGFVILARSTKRKTGARSHGGHTDLSWTRRWPKHYRT